MNKLLLITCISFIAFGCSKEQKKNIKVSQSSSSSNRVTKKNVSTLQKSKIDHIDELIGKYVLEDNDLVSIKIDYGILKKSIGCHKEDNSLIYQESEASIDFYNNNLIVVKKATIDKTIEECEINIEKGTYEYNLEDLRLEVTHRESGKSYTFIKTFNEISLNIDEKIQKELDLKLDDINSKIEQEIESELDQINEEEIDRFVEDFDKNLQKKSLKSPPVNYSEDGIEEVIVTPGYDPFFHESWLVYDNNNEKLVIDFDLKSVKYIKTCKNAGANISVSAESEYEFIADNEIEISKSELKVVDFNENNCELQIDYKRYEYIIDENIMYKVVDGAKVKFATLYKN